MPTKKSERYKRGFKLRLKTLDDAGEDRRLLLEAFHPDLMRYPIEFAFGDIPWGLPRGINRWHDLRRRRIPRGEPRGIILPNMIVPETHLTRHAA